MSELRTRRALESQVRNMHGQIVDLMKQIRERDDAMGELRGQLADLTSYCLSRAECGDAHPDEMAAYEEVARQLNEIRGLVP